MKNKSGCFQRNFRIERHRMALLIGLVFIALLAGSVALVSIVRLPGPVSRLPASAPAVLNIARMDDKYRNRLIEEEARLFDPAPLFLPTQYNHTQADFAGITQRDPAQTFQAVPPSYAYSDENFTIPFPDSFPLPARPVEAFDYGRAQTPYATLGRAEQPAAPLPVRMACVEIVDVKTGRTLVTLPISGPGPHSAGLPDPISIGELWSPLEFLASIDSTGLTSPPALMKGSGAPALVQYLSDCLGKTLHIDARPELAPGFYILRVGP